MLTETINRCIQAVEEKNDQQSRKHKIEESRAALGLLDHSIRDANALVEAINAMRANHLAETPVLQKDTWEELRQSVNQCGLEASSGKLMTATVRALQLQLKSARTELDTRWKAEAAAYADGPRGYLSMIANLTAHPADAVKLGTTIETLTTEAPTAKKIATLVDKVAEAKQITEEFSLKPEVEQFLKKVSAQRATLMDLTPGVVQWLQEKKLLGRIGLSIRRTQI